MAARRKNLFNESRNRIGYFAKENLIATMYSYDLQFERFWYVL